MEVWTLLFKGAFGDWFSWQNTLQRAAPLMLTALCVAMPARAGLIIIGGEGALVLGGLACAALPYVLPLPANVVGTVRSSAWPAPSPAPLWIMLAGWLRQYRGVNETISSLLLAYIAIGLFKHLVEGPLRDPASLNKPSTHTLAEGLRDRRHRRLGRALGPGARRRRLRRARASGCAGRPPASRSASSAATCARRSWSACRPRGWSSRPARWAAPAPAWPARSKWRRCTPTPTRR